MNDPKQHAKRLAFLDSAEKINEEIAKGWLVLSVAACGQYHVLVIFTRPVPANPYELPEEPTS